MDEIESGQVAVFETFPSKMFIEQVRAHIAATGLPETFPGIHRGPISKDEPFRILSPISIAHGKRSDGTFAPCPMCQPNKFLEGKLVWFWKLKAVAVIGHCCASALTRNEANAEYKQRETRERAETYLLEWLPKIGAHRKKALFLRPTVVECQRVFERFRKDGAKYQQALRKASRGGTELSVTELLGPSSSVGPAGLRTSGSTQQTRDVRFGVLSGQIAVAPTCTILADLEACLATFERLRIYGSEDEALDFIVKLDDETKSSMANELSRAIVGVSDVNQSVFEFRSFFMAANLERISQWGTHHDAPLPMAAKLAPFGERGARHFEIKSGHGRGFGLVIEPIFWGNINEAAKAA